MVEWGDFLKYSVFDVARSYCEAFRECVSGCSLVDGDNGFALFSYCIKSIYGIETNEYSRDIARYSKGCIRTLRKVVGVPRNINRLRFEDRLSVVNICQGVYASLTVVERGMVECRSGYLN